LNQLLTAYAEGHGQAFADNRFAVEQLLREEPEHQPLAERFGKLMGLWLQEAYEKRRQAAIERGQKLRRQKEEAMREEQERGSKKARNKCNNSKNTCKERDDGNEDAHSSQGSSSWPDAKDQHSIVVAAAKASPAPIRRKDVFDLAGLIKTDRDSSSVDEPSSDDEMPSSHKK
jgi:hypothetical protein